MAWAAIVAATAAVAGSAIAMDQQRAAIRILRGKLGPCLLMFERNWWPWLVLEMWGHLWILAR